MKNQSFAFTGTSHLIPTDRQYYLDWLRVVAISAVFLHHCSKIFDYHTTDLYNTVTSFVPSLLREFNALWMMPLFFIISGASVHYSLRSRNAGGFIRERIVRIAIPLVFIGTFVINPLQIYIKRLFHGNFSGNFFQWYPHYFDGVWPIGNFAPFGVGTHLWYLMSLFLFSLILLPLFIPFRKTGTSVIARISNLFVNPWALFLLFIPVSAASALFEAMGLGEIRMMGHWDQLSYLLFFAYGYLIFTNTRIQDTISKYGTTFLVAALILTALYLDSHFGVNLKISGVTEHDFLKIDANSPINPSAWIAVQAFRGIIGWCWILGLLDLGRRFLNFNNRFLAYANEAVLPFYILHHTIIYIVGFFIIQGNRSIGTKYFVIAIVSFAVIMAVYEILIRRVNILRILFGMKIKNDSRNWQTALGVVTGLFFVMVTALAVVSSKTENMSPPPTGPGLYINEEFGFQLNFPKSMNNQGKLTAHDVLFHIRHPKKTLYLKVRKSAVSANQPLDRQAGKKWIMRIMKSFHMKHPEVLSTETFTTPDGTKALYATIKFETRNLSLAGAYTFVNKNGKRLFIAGYNEDGFEPLERIMKSLTFKLRN
jgi:surface polysaccharide O-acyltransferase-like enzyme